MEESLAKCAFSPGRATGHSVCVKKVLTCTSPEVGSGGPRALQKVPKRALARVDPLKKGLLRVSALI